MTARRLLCELCACASTAFWNIMKIWYEWHCFHCWYCPPCSWALTGPGHAGSTAFSDSAAAAGPSDGLPPTLLCIPCQDSRAGDAAIRHLWRGKQQQGATKHAGNHVLGSCSCCCSPVNHLVCLLDSLRCTPLPCQLMSCYLNGHVEYYCGCDAQLQLSYALA